MNKLSFKILYSLVGLALLTPLIYNKGFYLPFTSAKTLFFYFIVELTLPFYVFVITNFPEYRPKLKNPILLGLFLFIAVGVTAGLFGINFQRSFWGDFVRMGGLVLWLHLILFFLYLLLVFQLSKKQWIVNYFFLVAVLASIRGILEFFGFIAPATEIFLGRSPSFFGNPIFFAAYLVIPFFLAIFYLFQSQEKVQRLFYGLAALIILLGILSSGTRSALLGVILGSVLGIALYLFMNPRIFYKKALWYGLAGGILVVGLFVWLGAQSGQGSNIRRLVDVRDKNTQNRLIQWKTALNGIKERPVLGVGPENYYYIANKYFDPQLYAIGSGWSDKPHNHLLETATTTGVVGLAGYLFLLGGIIFSTQTAFRFGTISLAQFCVFLSAVAAYQIQNLFAFDNISALFAFIFLAALAAYWYESADIKQRGNTYKIIYWPALLMLVFVGYFVYLVPVSNARVLSDLNKAINLAPYRPGFAREYFSRAFYANFAWDQEQIALKYEDSISTKIRNGFTESESGTVNQSLDGAIGALESVVSESKNLDVWINLANLYVLKARVNNSEINPRFEDTISTALELGPNRYEALAILAEARMYQGRDQEAAELLERIESIRPGATKE